MSKAKAKAEPETGIFPAKDFKGRPKLVNDRPGSELRLRSIKDGSVFGFMVDGYDNEGRPNQAQAQLLRTVSLKTEVNGRSVPVYYLDEGADPVSLPLGKGLPSYDVPVMTAELANVIEANKTRRSVMKKAQQDHVDANLKTPAKDKGGEA